MKQMLLLFVTSVLLINGATAFAQEVDVDDLVYMAENYPPANYIENKE